LIGYQLSGENANEKNLITGTRYLNVDGMLPFENLVADYVGETGNHVLYRVTPIFEGAELVARGVQMEAWSVEDNGDGICFNVYCHNIQPGVNINYATGESSTGDLSVTDGESGRQPSTAGYILNTNSKKFHIPSCSSVFRMSDKNKEVTNMSRADIILKGYMPCGICKP
jgi:DNA-entry nuclease